VQSGVTAVRAVYFAGELGTVSTTGAVLVAGAAAAAALGWVAFGLYSCGQALREGRMVEVRRHFGNGYARLLAQMTEQPPAADKSEIVQLLAITGWKSEFARLAQHYTSGADAGYFRMIDRLKTLGAAAITQDIDTLIKKRGPSVWSQVSERQRSKYGRDVEQRRRSYIQLLDQQMDTKSATLGIQLL